jgi:UrcA family protein
MAEFSDYLGTMLASSHLHNYLVRCNTASNHNRRPDNRPTLFSTPSLPKEYPMRFILPIIALAAIAAPLAAAPHGGDEIVTVRIDYADIDLASAEGRAALEARIDAKLREACTMENNSRYSFGRTIVDQKCVAEARTIALAEVAQVAAREARIGREMAAN